MNNSKDKREMTMRGMKMREIEFRCWSHQSNTMQGWEELKEHGDFYRILDMQDKYPMMQYTGLKDRNGVKIFEGDIIEALGNTNSGLKVEFKNEYAGGWVLTHPNSSNHLSLGARKHTEIEVIGNIHQNPELLK